MNNRKGRTALQGYQAQLTDESGRCLDAPLVWVVGH